MLPFELLTTNLLVLTLNVPVELNAPCTPAVP